MGLKGKHLSTGDLFRQPLVELINERHPVVRLAELIDWSISETRWSAFFPSKTGRPASPPRFVAGLLYHQRTFACFNEELVWAWAENPYLQDFFGETHFLHKPPIAPSSLTRGRQLGGEEGLEWLLTETIAAAQRGKIVQKQSFDKIIVDTTVIEKAVAYPPDIWLLGRGQQHLVRLATTLGIRLRQEYNRRAQRLALQVGRYAHAKQLQWMKASLKSLRTLVGRVWCDIDRKLDQLDKATATRSDAILARVECVLTHSPKDKKNRLHSLHAPEVECISKGKALQSYDLSDRGVAVASVAIWSSGQKRGVISAIKKAIHRRNAIESVIGHIESEGRLRPSWLKGSVGDALHAVLCGAGHNLRMILSALGFYFVFSLAKLSALLSLNKPINQVSLRPFAV